MDEPSLAAPGAPAGSRLAIVFDLFGTLVPQFPREANDAVLVACSEIVGLDAHLCRRAWRQLYDARVRGQVQGIVGHLRHVAGELQVELDERRLNEAHSLYRAFADKLVKPPSETLEALEDLTVRGRSLGLLSNAHFDVAEAFASSPLASLFTAAIFSCDVGERKPTPAAYAAVVAAMGVTPGEITFFGDGSDEELSGAASAGLRPVLIRSDLSNTYDPDRADVTGWAGRVVDSMSDVVALVFP